MTNVLLQGVPSKGAASPLENAAVIAKVLVILPALLGALPEARSQEESPLIRVGDEWRYLEGLVEPTPDPVTMAPTTEWADLDFDDGDWLVGATGIGYGDGDDQTVLTDMEGFYLTIYARKTFTVESVGDIEVLALDIDYDDGFVAYLNGVEVARSGVGFAGEPAAFDEPAVSHEAGDPETFAIDVDFLDEGENILAIQVHNRVFDSSDLSFIPELVANPDLCPDALSLTCSFDFADQSVTLDWINEAFYDTIEVWRNDTLLSDLLLGDSESFTDFSPLEGEEATYRVVAFQGGDECPGIECTVVAFGDDDILVREGDVWQFWRGISPPDEDWKEPDFDDAAWEFGPTGIGYGDGDDATSLDDMRDNYLTVFCRRTFELESLDGIGEILLNIVYDDGVVAHVNGEEIGRVNVAPGDVNELTSATTVGEPSTVEFSIDPDLLEVGDNAIAVSVHNANLTSSDLSFIPTLVLIPGGEREELFQRGNVDGNVRVNLTDAVSILNHLFRGAPEPTCPDSADTDDNGQINLSDAIRLLNHLFLGGEMPPDPGFDCGIDPTPDALGDCSTPAC